MPSGHRSGLRTAGDHTSAAFRADGFVVIEKVFTRSEVDLMKRELRRMLASGVLRSANGVCLGLSCRSVVFRRFNTDARLLDLLEPIIGPDIEFWTDRAVIKDRRVRFATPWHQDHVYWRGSHKVSAWISLDRATPRTGCLRVLPGSHNQGPIEHGAPAPVPGEGFRFRTRVDESKAIAVPAMPGSIVLFDDRTLHSSFPNRTGAIRRALISTFRAPLGNEPCYRDGILESFPVRGRAGS